MLRHIRTWWRGGLRAHERAVVNAVSEALSSDARLRFDEQLASVSRVVRSAGDKEVLLYRDALLESARFPFDAPTALLATVWLQGAHGLVRAEFWTVSGALFSLTLSHPPQRWDRAEPTRIEVWNDPMQAPPARLALEPARLQTWLADGPWQTEELQNVRGPLPAAAVARTLESLQCELPDDWVEWTHICDGMTCGGVTILGISEVRVAVLPDTELLLLTETDGVDVLAIDRTACGDSVLHVDLESGSRTPLARTFRAALQVLVRRRGSAGRSSN